MSSKLTSSADDDSPVDTVRELWSRYQDGDFQAGETLKAYLGTIAYADPKNAISQLDSLTRLSETN